MPTFIDLFSGCGGTSCGFKMAGWTSMCAVDIFEDALKTYKANFPEAETICDSVESEKVQQILRERYKGVDAVIGGPPCQGFSRRNMTASDEKKSELNKLPFVYAKLAISLDPKFIMMEEVPAAMPVVEEVVSIFEQAGYKVHYAIYLASNYMVPQNRKRVLIVAYLPECGFVPPIPAAKAMSVSEAFSIHPVPEHGACVSEKALVRVRELEESGKRLIGGNYGLMNMDIPSPTILTQSRASTGPYTIRRDDTYHKLSIQEIARLQSFPHDYTFSGTVTSIRTQIGNAVPPMLAKSIALGMIFQVASILLIYF